MARPAVVEENLQSFEFDPAPRSETCDRCGAGPEADLRFVILRGRVRYFGRTLCDLCAEAVVETLLGGAQS